MKRYTPYSHGIDIPAPAPWIEVRETVDDREVLHDTDHCHCVKCCVAYRVKYQQLTQTLNEITRDEVSEVITTLADALTYIGKLESTIGQIHGKVQHLDAAANQAATDVNDLDRGTPMCPEEELECGPGAWLTRNERHLRRMLAFRCSEVGALYGDDGELTDATMPFPIDYMRDSVNQIRSQLEKRALTKLCRLK